MTFAEATFATTLTPAVMSARLARYGHKLEQAPYGDDLYYVVTRFGTRVQQPALDWKRFGTNDKTVDRVFTLDQAAEWAGRSLR